MVCRTDVGRVVTMLYAIVGIPLTLLCIANIGSLLAKTARYLYIEINIRLSVAPEFLRRCFGQERRRVRGNPMIANYLYNTALAYGKVTGGKAHTSALEAISRETAKLRRKQSVRIPLHVILISFILYICLGAYMFSAWEGWEFLDGIYFCFVTLSTIVCFYFIIFS